MDTSPERASTNQADTTTQLDELRKLVEGPSAELWSVPVKITMWLRGGDPGEGFTSDMIEIELRPDGTATGIYTRAHFSLDYEPPYLVERFTAPVGSEEASQIVSLLAASPLFMTTYPAEEAPPVGDMMKESWSVSRGTLNLQKTFYHELPHELAREREVLAEFGRQVEQRGQREVLNPKRK